MDRRTFLNRAFIGLGLLLGAWGVQRVVTGDGTAVLDGEQIERIAKILAPVFGGPPTARFASAYLTLAPDESDRAVLVARLCAGWTPDQLAAPPNAVIAHFRRQHRDDFTSGRSIAVNGWIVSLTEARVAALATAG